MKTDGTTLLLQVTDTYSTNCVADGETCSSFTVESDQYYGTPAPELAVPIVGASIEQEVCVRERCLVCEGERERYRQRVRYFVCVCVCVCERERVCV